MKTEVWILGATGRTGTAVATRLHEAGVPLVLVGRSREGLETVAAQLDGRPRLVVGSLESTLRTLSQDAPGVVVNTVGPFTATGVKVARACPPGTHYVDVANEYAAVNGVLQMDREAAAAGQVYVTGAGFGVLATESVVLRLCAGEPRPARVRVDALASVAIEAGTVGTALAGTIAEIVSFGGREVRHGSLVNAKTAAHYRRLTTPDGENLATGSGASGELLAAWRASNADFVIAATTAAPSSPVLRSLLPVATALFRIPGVSRFAAGRIAKIKLRPQAVARPHSWAHARVEWPSGRVREAWLRVGDGTDFTADVTGEVTRRLLDGQGRPGAHTPGALFGPELAEAVGGKFVPDGSDNSDQGQPPATAV